MDNISNGSKTEKGVKQWQTAYHIAMIRIEENVPTKKEKLTHFRLI